LSRALYDAGLYCRADDRGDPVVQLAPPLICDQQHFDEMEQILRQVLTEASGLVDRIHHEGHAHQRRNPEG
jgi:adenosylmethionine-8-amino-7-oxononanoate aminotransferase